MLSWTTRVAGNAWLWGGVRAGGAAWQPVAAAVLVRPPVRTVMRRDQRGLDNLQPLNLEVS